MIFFIDKELAFPPVNLANEDGLLCFGGDLKPDRLMLAYQSGIFPWADDPVLWFSPDPRMIIEIDHWYPSKSLNRTLNKGIFEIKADTCFEEVIEKCAVTRESTWISEEFMKNYSELHSRGLAHSIEAFQEGKLVGGLYGLSMGTAFFGESMFHTRTDASKVAFSHLIYFLRSKKFSLLDCQISNPHLVSLGGIDISREDYMDRLENALNEKAFEGPWTEEFAKYIETSEY